MNLPAEQTPTAPVLASISAEVQRAMEEVQASLIIAQRFPRDINKVMQRISANCDQLSVALESEYTYSRGGTAIRGPSIRLAEVLQLSWGNMNSGVRELSRGVDMQTGIPYSEVESYAWDQESNTKDLKMFQVSHVRHYKNGRSKVLNDERDIYEHIANSAARRKRACMLTIIPKYIQDIALEKCRATVEAQIVINDDTVKALIKTFADYSVSAEQLETFLGHAVTIADLTRKEYLNLRNIYSALHDGMAKPGDYFDVAKEDAGASDADLTKAINDDANPQEKDAGAISADVLIERASIASQKELSEIIKQCSELTQQDITRVTIAVSERKKVLLTAAKKGN